MPAPPALDPERLAAFQALKSDLSARAVAGAEASVQTLFPSGLGDLDRALGGGFVRGTIAVLEGETGSGRSAIGARLLACATRIGLAAALDDGSLYPPALSEAGVRLERLVIVPAKARLGIARAVDILLRSRAFGVILMPAVALRAQVWSRLAGLAQKAGALVVALARHASVELAAFAATRIGCVLDRVRMRGAGGVFARLAGSDLRVRVLKHRHQKPGDEHVIVRCRP